MTSPQKKTSVKKHSLIKVKRKKSLLSKVICFIGIQMFLNIKEKFVCISMLLLSQTIQKNIQHEADLSTEAWNTIQSAFFKIPENGESTFIS